MEAALVLFLPCLKPQGQEQRSLHKTVAQKPFVELINKF